MRLKLELTTNDFILPLSIESKLLQLVNNLDRLISLELQALQRVESGPNLAYDLTLSLNNSFLHIFFVLLRRFDLVKVQ